MIILRKLHRKRFRDTENVFDFVNKCINYKYKNYCMCKNKGIKKHISFIWPFL